MKNNKSVNHVSEHRIVRVFLLYPHTQSFWNYTSMWAVISREVPRLWQIDQVFLFFWNKLFLMEINYGFIGSSISDILSPSFFLLFSIIEISNVQRFFQFFLPYLITAALSFTVHLFKNLITYYYQSLIFNNVHRITYILLTFDTLDFTICKSKISPFGEMCHCSDLELYWTSIHLLAFKYLQPHVAWLFFFSLSFILPPTLMSSLEKSATF